MMNARDNRRLLDKDFDRVDTRRTFWLFAVAAVIFAAIGVALFLNIPDETPEPERLASAANIDTPAVPEAYPEIVDTGETPTATELTRITPFAGIPGDDAMAARRTLRQEMFGPIAPGMEDTGEAGETVDDLTPALTRPITVIDVDGRPVGPVVQIDPTAGIDQNIRFTLSPELAEITNYTEAFLMPLEDMDIVALADGSYALQLDEQQTRFMAAYLLRVGGLD